MLQRRRLSFARARRPRGTFSPLLRRSFCVSLVFLGRSGICKYKRDSWPRSPAFLPSLSSPCLRLVLLSCAAALNFALECSITAGRTHFSMGYSTAARSSLCALCYYVRGAFLGCSLAGMVCVLKVYARKVFNRFFNVILVCILSRSRSR